MALTGLRFDTFSLYRVSFFTDYAAFQTPSKMPTKKSGFGYVERSLLAKADMSLAKVEMR
jgi:hypothetical protein